MKSIAEIQLAGLRPGEVVKIILLKPSSINNPMKALVIDASGGGGISRHGFGVANHLEQTSGHEVHMVVRTPNALESDYRTLPGEFFQAPTQIYGFNLSRIPGFVPMTLLFTLVWAVIQVRPHIVYCAEWFPSATISVMLEVVTRYRTTVAIHGLEVVYRDDESRYRQFTKKLKKAVLTRTAVVFAVSEFTRARAEELGVSDVKVCYNGVSDSLIKRSGNLESFDHNIDNIMFNGEVLITVARLQRYKGHDMVIQALPRILSSFPNSKYVIAGSGEAKNELMQLAKEVGVEDNVHLLGYVPDSVLPALYHRSNVFVMPTRITPTGLEGFGIAYLEANACDLPVIGTIEGGASAPIIDGYNGYLVDPHDPDEIASAVLTLLNNPTLATEMGQNGRERVQSEFNWDAVIEKIEPELRRVAELDPNAPTA